MSAKTQQNFTPLPLSGFVRILPNPFAQTPFMGGPDSEYMAKLIIQLFGR